MNEIRSEDLESVSRWHFAVGGLQTHSDLLALSQAIRIERVKYFPSLEELTHSLSNPLIAGILNHYGEDVVQHQLVIDAEMVDNPAWIPRTAGAILAAFRIRTKAEIVCPAMCNRSWSELSDIDPGTCIAYRVEPVTFDHKFGGCTLITPDDMDWVRSHVGTILDLTDQPGFQLALQSLCSYLQATNPRMMAAQLWSGIEAIFDEEFGFNFKLPLFAALFLEKRGPACRALRNEIKTLYKHRSRAVHGADVSDDSFRVNDVRWLLARILTRIIENGQMPTKKDFDDLTVMDNEFAKSFRTDSGSGG